MISPQMVVARVSGVFPETHDTATIRLDLNGHMFGYLPGQAINIDPQQFEALRDQIREHEDKTGSPLMPRAFSLSSHPLERDFVEITIKEEKARQSDQLPPVLSPFLVRKLNVGDPVSFVGPFGKYTVPEMVDSTTVGWIHVCAGSGIAPNRGIIKYALQQGWPYKHALFVQNKTPEDIIYRKELTDLERRHAGAVKVVNLISRPAQSKEMWFGRTGRITIDVLRAELEGFIDVSRSVGFVCGPNKVRGQVPGFVDQFAGNKLKHQMGLLGQLGLPFERIRTESW